MYEVIEHRSPKGFRSYRVVGRPNDPEDTFGPWEDRRRADDVCEALNANSRQPRHVNTLDQQRAADERARWDR